MATASTTPHPDAEAVDDWLQQAEQTLTVWLTIGLIIPLLALVLHSALIVAPETALTWTLPLIAVTIAGIDIGALILTSAGSRPTALTQSSKLKQEAENMFRASKAVLVLVLLTSISVAFLWKTMFYEPILTGEVPLPSPGVQTVLASMLSQIAGALAVQTFVTALVWGNLRHSSLFTSAPYGVVGGIGVYLFLSLV